MNRLKFPTSHHKYPKEIIEHTIWLHYKSKLSYLEIEELFAERGILVSYKSIRNWCNNYNPKNNQRLTQNRVSVKHTSNVDYIYADIHGQPWCLWCSYDDDGNVINIYLQSHRNSTIANRFLGCTLTN